jgi:hypothetical protein
MKNFWAGGVAQVSSNPSTERKKKEFLPSMRRLGAGEPRLQETLSTNAMAESCPSKSRNLGRRGQGGVGMT